MPIFVKHPVKRLSQAEFHQLDSLVMGTAYEVHNDFGRWLDEEVYESEMAYRLNQVGIIAETQFPITLEFEDFRVMLHADLFVGESTVYEFKAASAIAPAHRAQTLNYLLLTEGQHAKLVNFGGPRVEGEFISTSLTGVDRREIVVADNQWQCASETSRRLRDCARELVTDWGMFLECRLYRDALVHHFGGDALVHREIELHLKDRFVGRQHVDLIDDCTVLVVTGLSKQLEAARPHYEQLLRLSERPTMQWINFHKQRLEFITLTNPDSRSSR